MNKKWIKLGCVLLAILILITVLVYSPSVSLQKEYTTLDLTLTENEFFVEEDNYESEMKKTVQPYLAQYCQEGYSIPQEEVCNYYRSYLLPEDKGTVVISHGFTENTRKYDEVIYYFLKAGYSVYIIDHREHGYSTRFDEDLSKVSMKDFQTYIDDFVYFVENIVKKETKEEPLYLYAHSMGGAIGATVLEDYPELFEKAVLSSPMMEINLGVPQNVGKLVSNFMIAIGKGNNYLLGHGAYDGVQDELNPDYVSKTRYDHWYAMKDSNVYFQSNSGTYSWLKGCMKGIKKLLQEDRLADIKTPVLLFQAEKDSTVLARGQNTFVNGVESAELVLVENTEHTIYYSSNDVLIPYFNTIFAYFES